MNVKGKYKYYVKYDGLRHNLWMVIKYKVDDTKKVYKTNFNITEFINDFQSIFFEDPKDTFRRTSRIYADYILNCGVMDMLRFIVCKDIEKKHIVATEKNYADPHIWLCGKSLWPARENPQYSDILSILQRAGFFNHQDGKK